MLFDAHTHLYRGALPRLEGYYQLVSASTPEECHLLDALRKEDPRLYYSCGVHPWRSDTVPVSSLASWLSAACAVGEIGMDNVWCTTDLQVQRQVFREQLHLAEALQKPVILHTKGCETEVLEEIAAFSIPILVHWYSSEAHLEGYLKKDCYFTVGPDFQSNPAVRQVATIVPLHRLMIESDGVEGASWALGRRLSLGGLPGLLRELIASLARLRGLTPAAMEETLFQNTLRFIQRTSSPTLSPSSDPRPVHPHGKKQIP
jgi:TatD DNase family protein